VRNLGLGVVLPPVSQRTTNRPRRVPTARLRPGQAHLRKCAAIGDEVAGRVLDHSVSSWHAVRIYLCAFVEKER
jgi:hypothetical protein